MKRFLSALILAVMLVCMLTGCGSMAPNPQIKEGEFNFSVTYEFNGETKTVSGVYVCEYDGRSWVLDGGWGRDWKGHIKGGEFEDVIEIGTDEDGNTIELNLVLDPEYLMGDFVEGYDTAPEPYISVTVIDDGGLWFMCEPADVEAHCGAKIVSYEYDERIKNSFGR